MSAATVIDFAFSFSVQGELPFTWIEVTDSGSWECFAVNGIVVRLRSIYVKGMH